MRLTRPLRSAQVGGPAGRLLAQLDQPLALAAQGRLPVAGGGQPRLQRLLGGGQLVQFQVERGQVLGRLLAPRQ